MQMMDTWPQKPHGGTVLYSKEVAAYLLCWHHHPSIHPSIHPFIESIMKCSPVQSSPVPSRNSFFAPWSNMCKENQHPRARLIFKVQQQPWGGPILSICSCTAYPSFSSLSFHSSPQIIRFARPVKFYTGCFNFGLIRTTRSTVQKMVGGPWAIDESNPRLSIHTNPQAA